MNGVLAHRLLHEGEVAFMIPVTLVQVRLVAREELTHLDVVILVVLNGEESLREASVVDVADDDVQIRVLRMVEVVEQTRLRKFELLTEFRDEPRFDVDDVRVREPLFEQIRDDLRRLTRLHQLTVNEA